MRSMTQAGSTTGVEVLSARDVPLGGPRALQVRRTIPPRARTLIGAWCFADHYGPVEVPAGGMDLPPHPHTGLQTVSWLFGGTIEHRDSLGTHSLIRPGELNLMTGGHGIAHSEVSTADTTVLHGVQLWVALPDADREAGRDFSAPRAGARTDRRGRAAGLPRLSGRRDLSGADVHPPCWVRSSTSSRTPRCPPTRSLLLAGPRTVWPRERS
ncbi:pirin family protein [Streptosporangium sp. NPDC023825]|uniref:pirin family protein n=1 Tax=Streptosporangium sp. NPDC023825 TaxID=3154909 RepID=UPI003433D91F